MSNNDPHTRDDQTRFTMRIDSALMERIRALAAEHKRSAAKEIEFILEEYCRNVPKE